MDWTKVETKSTKGIFVTQLNEGDNIVRVAGLPKYIGVHYPKSYDKVSRVNCPGVGCPLCANGEKLQDKYQFPIIDREDGTARLLEVGSAVVGGIKKLANHPKLGDPTTYDIDIKRTGTGLNTKYSVLPVTPVKKSRLTEDELANVAALYEVVDKKLTEPANLKDIMDLYSNDDFGSDITINNTDGWSDIND